MVERYDPEKVATLKKRPPDFVFLALFGFFKEATFTTDMQAIHTTVYELKEKPEYKDLFKDLRFVRQPHFMYSPDLEQAFARLEEGLKLQWLAPRGREYIILPRVMKMIHSDVLPEFSAEEQETLKRLAQDFEERLAGFQRPPIS